MKKRFRNWSDIRVFLAVVREGSTLAASRKLGMAQPTVARRIDALEHEIGVSLFHRDTRGFRPTDHATKLFQHAEALESAASAFATAAFDLAHIQPIRITAFTTNLSENVMAIISEFSDRHPEVQFEFLPSIKVFDLMANEADIALRLVRGDLEPDLIRRKISDAKFTLFGAKSYAGKHGLPARPEDMAGHTLLSFKRSGTATAIHSWFLKYVTEDQISRNFHDYNLLTAALLAGQGLGVMNLKQIEAQERDGKILRCFEPPDELTSEHMILVAPDAYERLEVRRFVKFFAPRYAALFK